MKQTYVQHVALGLAFLLQLHVVSAVESNDAPSGKQGEGSRDQGEFLFAPVPILQPALGGGVVLVGLQFHPHEPESPANITGAAVGYTSTDSYLIGISHDRRFQENRWRFVGTAGYAKFNLEFYGIGADSEDSDSALKYSVEGTFIEPRLLRQFSGGWSGGISAQFLDALVNFKDLEPEDGTPEDVTEDELDLTSYGVGLIALKDTRDNRFAPVSGQYFEATASLFPSSLGNDLDYQIFTGAYSQYWGVRDSTVLAANVRTAYADGQVPFYRLSKLNFRGVSGDTYWDKFLLQGQAEIRQQIKGNWSAAVFAGYGGVSSSPGDLTSEKMILAGGVGIRYLVSAAQRVALRLDVAKGQDDVMVYISIGEAF